MREWRSCCNLSRNNTDSGHKKDPVAKTSQNNRFFAISPHFPAAFCQDDRKICKSLLLFVKNSRQLSGCDIKYELKEDLVNTLDFSVRSSLFVDEVEKRFVAKRRRVASDQV
jgi:hypothetical protein